MNPKEYFLVFFFGVLFQFGFSQIETTKPQQPRPPKDPVNYSHPHPQFSKFNRKEIKKPVLKSAERDTRVYKEYTKKEQYQIYYCTKCGRKKNSKGKPSDLNCPKGNEHFWKLD